MEDENGGANVSNVQVEVRHDGLVLSCPTNDPTQSKLTGHNLCAFCNQRLIAPLPKKLEIIHDELMRAENSYSNPSDDNPLACEHKPGNARALQLRIALCGGHVLEMEGQAALADGGWGQYVPSEDDFSLLATRVRSLQGKLTEIMTCPDGNVLFKHITREVEKHGAQAFRSLAGIRRRMEWERAG